MSRTANHFRRIAVAGLLVFLVLVPAANAADIINGWSPVTRLTSVYSTGSMTMFKLREQPDLGFPNFRIAAALRRRSI
jgi:hypothetical protein